MRQIIVLTFILISLNCYSQTIHPSIETRDYANYANYKGKVFEINKNILFRTKIYGKKYVQNTIILKKNKKELRFYVYLNIIDVKITPALSIRLLI